MTALNRENAHRLGLPEIGTAGPVAPRLAVVGGGASVLDHLDDLRAWDGEIWAVNGVWPWLRAQGIEATFYSIDAMPGIAEGCGDARRAVLGDICDPGTYDTLHGARIEIAYLDTLPHGSTSAASAPMIGIKRGHREITFFGCDSSFGDATHVHKNEAGQTSTLWVRCGPDNFVVTPQMIMQAEYLADLIRALPEVLRTVGGGFLPALAAHGDYEVTHISRDLHERIYGAAAPSPDKEGTHVDL